MNGMIAGRDIGARCVASRAVIAALVLLAPAPAFAEGRTVTGAIVRLDAAAGTFTVKDAAGVAWSYTVDPDAGIDLGGFREGDRVTVTIARATPLNMNSAADRLRKGDRVGKTGF
jgi:hypothetical protein